MRFLQLATGATLLGLTSVVLTGPAGALAPAKTRTVTTSVKGLCTFSNFIDPTAPAPFPPRLVTVPVTLTVPRRVHRGALFFVHLAIATESGAGVLAASATLSGSPGVTPTDNSFQVNGPVPVAGNLPFTATGRVSTVTRWRLSSFGAVFFNGAYIEENCTPTTPTPVLARTHIIAR